MMKCLTLTCALILLYNYTSAQTCTAPGQNPVTAFPVCGTTVFHQSTVPICGNTSLKVPGCDGSGGASYENKNPFWYKFTCFQSGTLGFLITPTNLGDDYDWQLYDITGHTPDEVFTNASLIVTGNWAGTYGKTGASNTGVSFIQCASLPANNENSFAKMPQLLEGHIYLLLISHYTDSQSGYDLSFGGGTAVITDPTLPRLQAVEPSCDGTVLRLKLGKNIQCNSIAANGSDFKLSGTSVSVIGTSGFNCDTKFDTDSLVLQLSAPLPPGNYQLGVKDGSDGNTLLDYCDNAVQQTESLPIVITAKTPTLMDRMETVTCAPQQVTLLFQKPMRCASVAADGSNFKITGTYPIQLTAAAGNCSNDLSKTIQLTFSKPLTEAGTFTITLQKDFDGNTIIDECGEETPAGSTLSFTINDTVNADFTYALKYGCARDTIVGYHDGAHGVNSWSWDMDDRQRSTTQNGQGIYTSFTEKNILLAVSNGFCSDTASQSVVLDNNLKADFSVFDDNCPLEPITFTGMPQGNVVAHRWDFGDGGFADTQNPVYTYLVPDRQSQMNVRYTITDALGCQSSTSKPITLYTSCYVAVPTAFTPNNDGRNDLLAPLNAVKAIDLQFRIFNRWGQLLYTSTNWKAGWDGNFKDKPQPSATYVWMLQYTNRDTGKTQQQKGTAVLIR
ncbi:MAG TPA: gliding motility-associated C-terminal domain-containing protein [Chitinophagaceae bacterium]|nr:gliding motility-associated C-terminal domain-containing protein [Chitinophagaceae bacterium]